MSVPAEFSDRWRLVWTFKEMNNKKSVAQMIVIDRQTESRSNNNNKKIDMRMSHRNIIL